MLKKIVEVLHEKRKTTISCEAALKLNKLQEKEKLKQIVKRRTSNRN